MKNLENTLTKLELTNKLSQKLLLKKRDSKNLVDSFFQEISEILCSGSSVQLPGFGKFIVRNKVARLGRNPKTGKNFPIVARSVVIFQASQYLKNCVRNI